jgi:hypothetical protein
MAVQPLSQSATSITATNNQQNTADELSQSKAVAPQDAQKQLNAAILSSALKLNLSSGNEPLSLFYKAALDNINAAFTGTPNNNANESRYQSTIGPTPETTADRLISVSVALFPLFQQQRPDLSEQEAANAFAKTIGDAIDSGFGETQEILSTLTVLKGSAADNIVSTYELVQQKLQTFVDSFSGQN